MKKSSRPPWGQNFLAAPATARRIVSALGSDLTQPVIEIGPGRGALTQHLLERGNPLTVVELDPHLARVLKARWGHEPQLTVIQSDFLDWPLPSGGGPYLVIGNLPYSAGAAMIQKVVGWRLWTRAVVMVQREVARRITSVPGGKNWGLLSLSVQSRARAKELFDVPPGAFRPAPKVMSTVLELERLSVPRVSDFERLMRVSRAAFGQRRKTLVNSLSHGLGLGRAIVEQSLLAAGIDPGVRPESLSVESFDRIGSLLPPGQVEAEDVGQVIAVPEQGRKGHAEVP